MIKTLKCHVKECNASFGRPGGTAVQSQDHLEAMARAEGWVSNSLEDICPYHAAAEAAPIRKRTSRGTGQRFLVEVEVTNGAALRNYTLHLGRMGTRDRVEHLLLGGIAYDCLKINSID